MIMFRIPDEAREEGFRPIENTSDHPWRSETTKDEYDAIRDIERVFGSLMIEGRDADGIINVTLPRDAADKRCLYEHLYVAFDGRVAQAMTNHPTYHADIDALVSAEAR